MNRRTPALRSLSLALAGAGWLLACRSDAPLAPLHRPPSGSPGILSPATIPILDAIGVAPLTTQFSVFGSFGVQVSSQQFAGAEFTLLEPTAITELGGFLNNCVSIVGGVPQCPGTLPLTVQIRPSTNGLPDPSTVLASFRLSHDNNPLIHSYEFATVNLSLAPGSYFALFGAQGSDVGVLMSGASVPFPYLARPVNLGVLTPAGGTVSSQFAAVLILGSPTPGFSIDLLPGDPDNVVHLRTRTFLQVAVLSSDTFDATALNWEVCRLGDGSAPDARVVGPRTGTRDVNQDGRLDLQLAFRVRALVELGDLTRRTTSLRLTCGTVADDDAVIVD